MTNWCPNLASSDAPRYLAIADCIEQDIASGALNAGDRLPAQRRLAAELGLDFTTVARGYAEARRRGVIASQVGSGTFITGGGSSPGALSASSPRRVCEPDFSMNLPPEPDTESLRAKLQDGLAAVSADLPALMRYQTLEKSEQDLQAGATWLQRIGISVPPAQIQIAPGAQAALAAILSTLTNPGDKIACESITYPGIRSLCAQMHLELTGLPMDKDGIEPEALETACRNNGLKALYLNPTLQNPTTLTLPLERRSALIEIARRHQLPILEDDPYSQLLPKAPPAFAALAPEITWHIASLSKSLGAGLRLAYAVPPSAKAGWQLSRALRTSHVMPSLLMTALATHWIESGLAGELCAEIATESAQRQNLARSALTNLTYKADPNGFHLWLTLQNGWTRAAFAGQLRALQIGVTESDAFTVSGAPPEAIRLCLGGPLSRSGIATALETIASLLETSPEQASAFF